jgi:hypothetical protein
VDKKKLQEAQQRDGHYLLRSNLIAEDPQILWTRYVLLTQIEAVFRSLKSQLGIRPIYHQLEHRADAHILVAFLAYCLQVTLKHRLLVHAPGLTPAAVLENLSTIQMIDVCIPTIDGRQLLLPRSLLSKLGFAAWQFGQHLTGNLTLARDATGGNHSKIVGFSAFLAQPCSRRYCPAIWTASESRRQPVFQSWSSVQ